MKYLATFLICFSACWLFGQAFDVRNSSGTVTASIGPDGAVYGANARQWASTLISSTGTTNQIDFSLSSAFRWTNMVTNIVLQITNIVADKEIDFYFEGGTNTGPNYSVQFTIPSPAGVNMRWGFGWPTNGANHFIVTNNFRASVYLKAWLGLGVTNIEAYWQPLR